MQILTQKLDHSYAAHDLVLLCLFSKSEKHAKVTIKESKNKNKNKNKDKDKDNEKSNEKNISAEFHNWPKEIKDEFVLHPQSANFSPELGKTFSITTKESYTLQVLGLGSKKDLTMEKMRRNFAKIFREITNSTARKITILTDTFILSKNEGSEEIGKLLTETMLLTSYEFNKYKKPKESKKLTHVYLQCEDKKDLAKLEIGHKLGMIRGEAISITRDLVNEPPNVLNSETFAKYIVEDVKKNLKGVTVTVLGKDKLTKEKMNLFLSVNKGSAYEPQLVCLNYKPKKSKQNNKHIALVGKGLTFDSGGYSLKPSTSMVGMKYDMAGAATVYGAFRASVLNSPDVEVSCFLAMTDNMVSSYASTPDSIVQGRNGLFVEILNTDAEGRLVLADVLSFVSDIKPNLIIDVATLTGACVRALGPHCGVMGNNKKQIDHLLSCAEFEGEGACYLPIFEDYREDMVSKVADLKNIGGSGDAGAQKAAAFLEKFVGEDIPWIHLDIAGVGTPMPHLPYASHTFSGAMVRTLAKLILDA